ncbi:MAG: hypothetical protein IIY21_24925 [Clostridiales bacterium]|nr:hypothetical protein [Clostridiales bacterium]MBQ1574614.1 hypothetical protein [Clostridiales bacterium]
MSFASKHNKGSRFEINIENWEFKRLSDLEVGGIYQICGLYINTKSKFGDHPVAMCTEEFLVDLPQNMTEEVKKIIADDDDISDIVEGKVGMKVTEYHSDKYNRDCLGVQWVDVK